MALKVALAPMTDKLDVQKKSMDNLSRKLHHWQSCLARTNRASTALALVSGATAPWPTRNQLQASTWHCLAPIPAWWRPAGTSHDPVQPMSFWTTMELALYLQQLDVDGYWLPQCHDKHDKNLCPCVSQSLFRNYCHT